MPSMAIRKTIPSTCSWVTTPADPIASAHQPARPLVQPFHAAAIERTAKKPIGFGFQMNVDSSIAAGDTASSVPATRPATGPATRPPIERASHHVSATAAIPSSAMKAVTATGSPPESAAAGASRK